MPPSTVLAITLLFATAIFPSKCDPHGGEHLHHSNKKLLHAEKLGELYYQNQLKERNGSLTYHAFIHLNQTILASMVSYHSVRTQQLPL